MQTFGAALPCLGGVVVNTCQMKGVYGDAGSLRYANGYHFGLVLATFVQTMFRERNWYQEINVVEEPRRGYFGGKEPTEIDAGVVSHVVFQVVDDVARRVAFLVEKEYGAPFYGNDAPE